MKTSLLDEHDGLRTFALVLDSGDEAMASLTSFAADRQLRASHFTAIGAFSSAVVAYFDWAAKTYRHIAIDEQVEVLSLSGDITTEDGKPKVHAHVVLGKADATAHGGHLIAGRTRPTLEVVITECRGTCTDATTRRPASRLSIRRQGSNRSISDGTATTAPGRSQQPARQGSESCLSSIRERVQRTFPSAAVRASSIGD